MHERGKFFSWTIISDEVAVKHGDKSAVIYNESGVPQEIIWFFEAEIMGRSEQKSIVLRCNDVDYNGIIRIDPKNRVKIDWSSELGNRIRLYYAESGKYPILRFEKLENDIYEVEVIY